MTAKTKQASADARVFRDKAEIAKGLEAVVVGELWHEPGGALLVLRVEWPEKTPRVVRGLARDRLMRVRQGVIDKATEAAGQDVDVCDYIDTP